ncbi:MAG: type II toxin-antitoxin system RelE/ParE family toxin [Candidatus Gracilibacteria bacterium]|nr:type II toxin-antitoxin system RelE/ParE family toxin [Candidatus Gracilibacteria bacterium]
MIIEVDESFKKDFKNLKNEIVQKRVIEKLDEIEKLSNVAEISNVKKMKGFDKFYRIRVGDYRIGFELSGETIIVLRVRSRKDIYNIFP